jgi:transcriptional regulator with XRE-family HTH domain
MPPPCPGLADHGKNHCRYGKIFLMDSDLSSVLGAVGPRLRTLRQQRGITLSALAESTGISVSTLSRLESGQRKPTLELLLPLARAYGVPLDDLAGGPPAGDPRVHLRPLRRHGMTVVPLTRRPGGIQAYKLVIPVGRATPDPRVHQGYEWLYILDGELRLVLGDRDVVLRPGEAAEFDTRVPHWFGSRGEAPAEVLSLFGPQGERTHLRAAPASAKPD